MGTNNKEAENCWEFWDCPVKLRDTCIVYTSKSGKDCYNLTYNFSPICKKEFIHCWECPWYKKVQQDLK